MATIEDVASRAGVSIKTVSRILNHYPHVSERTRLKVEAAISELDYRPSVAARQMRSGESLGIGMLYGDPSSGYQARLNHSMLKACSVVGRYLAVELFDEKTDRWVDQVKTFLDHTNAAHLVLVPPLCDHSGLHELLRVRGVSFVLISPSRPIRGAMSVSIDDRLAAMEMTQHLIDLGHRRIGHIAGHEDHIASLLRRLGFTDAHRQSGLEIDDRLIGIGQFTYRDALSVAERMLSDKDRPTAIFAANDTMAMAAIMKAAQMGLKVPEDVSVAGFDDIPMSETIWPGLTTIAQPFDEIAMSAVILLTQPKGSEQRTHAILPHRLVKRESVLPPPP
jgi:LacI family transcriptional regulator